MKVKQEDQMNQKRKKKMNDGENKTKNGND